MKRAAKAGIVVAGVVAVGLAGAITLNASQMASHSEAGAPPSATASAAPSASAKAPSATPNAASGASASPSAPSPSAAPAPGAAPSSAQPETTAAAPAPEAPAPAAPAPAAPAPAPAPAPAAGGLDAAAIQHIKDSCTARLQADAASSAVVSGTVVPRPFTVVSITFSGAPVRSTGTSGLPAYDILMHTTTKLADGPTQDGQRVCRVYDSDTKVDWLPVG